MHTATELSSQSFTIQVNGSPGNIHSGYAGFSAHDRLGVVVRDPGGAMGARWLILAAITAYYDVWRSRSDDFFIYPDYFRFHVARPLGDPAMLDIWPSR